VDKVTAPLSSLSTKLSHTGEGWSGTVNGLMINADMAHSPATLSSWRVGTSGSQEYHFVICELGTRCFHRYPVFPSIQVG
jgi:hypothetical protein